MHEGRAGRALGSYASRVRLGRWSGGQAHQRGRRVPRESVRRVRSRRVRARAPGVRRVGCRSAQSTWATNLLWISMSGVWVQIGLRSSRRFKTPSTQTSSEGGSTSWLSILRATLHVSERSSSPSHREAFVTARDAANAFCTTIANYRNS